MPLISVIVPVYNVEKYLWQSVRSVLSQSYYDVEVILVNDGSTDSSLSICKELSFLDSRVKVIDKQNGGVADARNYGISAACGEYLMFLDSDDYWASNDCLINLVKVIEGKKPDVIIGRSIDYYCNSGRKKKAQIEYDVQYLESLPYSDLISYMIRHKIFPGSAWIVVSRTKMIRDNSLYFQKGIKAEDIDWLLAVFNVACRCSFFNDAFYVYRKYRDGSITSTADKKSLQDVLWIINKWYKKIMEKKCYPGIEKPVLEFLSCHYLIAIMMYASLSKYDKYYFRGDILSLISLISFKYNLNYIFYITCKVFGLGFLSKALYAMFRVKKRLVSL